MTPTTSELLHALLDTARCAATHVESHPEALARGAALLRETRGLILGAGCGKSAFVAMKMASTLASLGLRGRFLDPAHAAHGEAALLRGEDLFIAISRSGESDELVALALGAPCPVLAITARPESRLGRTAKVVLPVPDLPEAVAGVPGASWLASGLMAELLVLEAARGPDGEIRPPGLHAAGALGRGLALPVSRVMHAPPLLDPDAGIDALLALLTERALGAVLLAREARLLGIVTDGDLRRAVRAHGPSLFERRAHEIATPGPVTVRADASLAHALECMERRPSQIQVLPVLDEEERVVGLLRLHDIARAGIT